LQAVKRLVDRNGLSGEEALKRIDSQMTNKQRVARANVVLCTLWHPDVTQKQVKPIASFLWALGFIEVTSEIVHIELGY